MALIGRSLKLYFLNHSSSWTPCFVKISDSIELQFFQGIEFKLPTYMVPPTKAYCLVDYAATVGKQVQTVKQLYKTYHVDDKRIDSVETLKEIALKCGLDPDEAAR